MTLLECSGISPKNGAGGWGWWQRRHCVLVGPAFSLMVGRGRLRRAHDTPMEAPWSPHFPKSPPFVSLATQPPGPTPPWDAPRICQDPFNHLQIPLPLASTRWRAFLLCSSWLGFGGGVGGRDGALASVLLILGGESGYALGQRIKGGEWKAEMRCRSHTKTTGC